MTAEISQAQAKPLIMVVDDKEILRYTLRLMLEDLGSGYQFIEAESGEQAIELARARRPHLILMDISMPGMSGIEATKRIKNEFGDIAVIALSMHVLEDMERAMTEAGADGYLAKDAASEEILAAIEGHLARKL